MSYREIGPLTLDREKKGREWRRREEEGERRFLKGVEGERKEKLESSLIKFLKEEMAKGEEEKDDDLGGPDAIAPQDPRLSELEHERGERNTRLFSCVPLSLTQWTNRRTKDTGRVAQKVA